MIITINCDEISDNIRESIDFFIKHKVRYIELRSINKKNLLDYSLEEIKDFKKLIIKKKLKVAAIASPLFKWFYNKPLPSIKFDKFFFNPTLSTSQKKLYINKAIDIAEILETNYIRIFSNLSDGKIKPDVFWNDELLQYALEKAKVNNKYLLLENEPICTVYKKRDIKMTFKKINNPHLKLWLDIANFYQTGDYIFEEDIQSLGRFIKYIHLKDIVKEPFKYVPFGEGEINYKRILTDITKYLSDDIILSLETHVKENKNYATFLSLKNLRNYLSQKRIKYAIVGAGRISKKHSNAIRENSNSELRGVFDLNKVKKENFAKSNDVTSYTDFQSLINDKSVDVVSICTPHCTHVKIAEQAVVKDKIVLCEKPFVLSSKTLSKALRNKKIRDNVFIVLQNNFNQAVKFLYKLVEEKRLGKINYFSINLRWWRDKKYYSDWHGNKKQSGGVLFNQAIHSLAIINRVLRLNPVKITTYTAKFRKNLKMEDTLISIIKLKNGALGVIEVFLHSTFKNVENSLFLSGTKGTIKIGGTALNKILYIDTKEPINIIPLNSQNEDLYGNGHKELIKTFSRFLLGNYSSENKLLVKVSELESIIRFIEMLYLNEK